MPWIKAGINKILPSVIFQPIPQIPKTLKILPRDSIIVDIGAGGRKISKNVICIDSFTFPNTDIVADIHNLPLKNNIVDAIFCTGVLEHIVNPDIALTECYRVLRPNGIVHLEVPFLQPYHKDPEDYWRWTMDGIRLFAKRHRFTEVRFGSLIGPASAMNALTIAYFQSWFRNRYIRKGIDFILSFWLFPLKFFDFILLNQNVDLLSAIYYVGRKYP